MSDSSILNNAARILRLVATGTPADQALRESLTQTRHYTAPAERRGVSRAVFTYFRWWRWLNESDSPQKQLAAALDLQDRFNKSPASFKTEALAARAVPDWLKAEVGTLPAETLIQLQREPALWIRAKAGTGMELAKKLSHFTPAPQSADALRYSGLTDLYRTKEFQNGEFEIQDLASQLVGLAAAPQPGETWWDACAGEGGKTMHLSDLMQNKGLIWASDRSLRRLAKLKERAARAKVFNFRAAPWEGGTKPPTKTKFDGILVDAPCTGVGTWQRNPHARWTTLPKDVHELAAVQKTLLDNVAGSLKPGGRLVYAVCTLTRAETTGVADAFTAAHPELIPDPVLLPGDGQDKHRAGSFALAKAGGQTPNAQQGTTVSQQRCTVFLWPHELNANGMFIAAWRRK